MSTLTNVSSSQNPLLLSSHKPVLSSKFVLVGLLTVCIAIGTFGFYTWKNCPQKETSEQSADRLRLCTATVSLIGMVLWIVIFQITIGMSAIQMNPALLLALVFPILVTFLQMKNEVYSEDDSGILSLPLPIMDAGVIISVAFAMATLMTALPKSQNISSSSEKVVMYALLVTVAFIVPLGHFSQDSTNKEFYQSLQRVLLNYAIGFIIAGILFYLKNLKT